MKFIPHDYQTYAIERIMRTDGSGNRNVALFLEPGLGKTVITLTAINQLMFHDFEIRKVLVVAPLRVAEDTWSRECEKWNHLKHLRISKVLGSALKRKKALEADADIYIINRENVEWLAGFVPHDFDMLVVDELSSFKSHTTKRFKALAEMRKSIQNVVGLTGTPTPNGLTDLWAEMFLVDKGHTLGEKYWDYISKYFNEGRTIEKNGKRIVLEYKPKDAKAKENIYHRIHPNSVSMKAADWLKLPERIDTIVPVKLNEQARQVYEQLESSWVAQLADGEVSAADEMIVPNKLLQIAIGAVYDRNGNVIEIHQAKLDALEELVEAANGHPVLVFYSFQHDYMRIMKHLSQYRPQKLENADDIKKWNDGKIGLLLAHPASAGHGLNLQAGGHIIVWFGLTWSLELYEQANARLHRQGQNQSVIVHHIIAENTIEETIMQALKSKANVQNALMGALKAKINKGALTV